MSDAKRHGLKLKDDFGAPAAPHVIPDVPGTYRPDIPTPVGGEGELALADARTIAKDHSDVLELVSISTKKVGEAEETAKQDRLASINVLGEASRAAEDSALEQARIEAETQAVKEG